MNRLIFFITASLAFSAAPSPEGRSWWRHVQFLASDKLEGRNAGSPGHRLAADYVAGQFKKAGLAPCGENSYLQQVPLVNKRLVESESSLSAGNSSGGLALPR